ncbi:MAG: hypothetical protein E5X59_18925, partial [Mesorhizobium sp.]
RAIARRKDLNPTIAQLIRALEKPTLVSVRQQEAVAKTAPESAEVVGDGSQQVPGAAAENARRRLRSMMRDAESGGATINPFSGANTYVKLRETALTGNAAFFQTALADALEIDFSTARSLTANQHYTSLLAALRALDLGEERAFLITAAVYPAEFSHSQAIRIFLDRYRLLHRDAALDRLRGWKAETLSKAIRNAGPIAANADSRKADSDDTAASPKARRV